MAGVELLSLLERNVAQAKSFYLGDYGKPVPIDPVSSSTKLKLKIRAEYGHVQHLSTGQAKPSATAKQTAKQAPQPTDDKVDEKTVLIAPGVTVQDITHRDKRRRTEAGSLAVQSNEDLEGLVDSSAESALDVKSGISSRSSTALIRHSGAAAAGGAGAIIPSENMDARTALILKNRQQMEVAPTWHAPWVLKTVLSGHTGWVRCVAVDSSNEWFCSGSADRTIKIWDLASGTLKLTLTGHINTVRGLAVSDRHPYLFSCAEDKKVLCWDLEYNKIIRSYHGHLSAVYSLALHPVLDVLISGGRDSTARVWDMRTKQQIRALTGHTNTIGSIVSQSVDPQVITGSHDSTMRCWDLATGKCSAVLTNHKKSVRSMVLHPKEYTWASGAADNIKIWKGPDGTFLRNVSGHNAIVNSLAINPENVLVSGADNGTIKFWDWKSGHCFQSEETKVQPGSLDSEAGIFDVKFDRTGSRLIMCEADKTIKIWKENETATPESHPIDWKPTKKRKKY